MPAAVPDRPPRDRPRVRGRSARAVAAVAAAVGATLASATPARAAAPAPRPVLATPVLSLRRVPGVVTATIADARLASSLGKVLAEDGAPAEKTCLSVRDPDGRTVLAHNPGTPLIPASSMKLATATAALAKLGPDAHLTTELRAAAAPADGAVKGDLWMVGGGDPLLATADFAQVAGYQQRPRTATPMEALADRVVAAGVRRVEGRVVGDESRYDTQRYVPSWSATYATSPEIGPQSALIVNGGFSPFRPRAVPSPAPATMAAATLTGLLRARGVTVDGEAAEGKAPSPGAAVASIDSPPLREVVGVMLQESDNLTAELLVKELGVRFGGAGTTAAGLGVVKSTLASLSLEPDGVAAVDGSGLDRSDRLTCDALQATLAHGGENGQLGQALPVAGRNGTLAKRFTSTPAAGKVKAKTGTLAGVTALTGWTATLDGRSLQFALVANDLPGEAAGTALQDRLVSALAAWPQAPGGADIGPRPPTPARPA